MVLRLLLLPIFHRYELASDLLRHYVVDSLAFSHLHSQQCSSSLAVNFNTTRLSLSEGYHTI